MKPCNVQEIIKNNYEDPIFFIDMYNVGRGFVGKKSDHETPYIKHSNFINIWRIVDDNLQKINKIGLLFDTETYLIQWNFELALKDTVQEESLFYYWKGDKATKGFSPLPEEIENQNPIVERISQWSEPALFFHMFPCFLTVFNGKQESFDSNSKRLFIVRGEIENEIHLYEIPSLKDNLRSRAIFLLVDPRTSTIIYWYGASVPLRYQQLVKNKVNLSELVDSWKNFKYIDVQEGENDQLFVGKLEQSGGYVSTKNREDFTPRLFYFNSFTGDFLATEIEYPLRINKQCMAPFPFLQSHLYTATQPALFMLDNDTEIWLWEGWKLEESNLVEHKMELELAKKTAIEYAKEKAGIKGFQIPVKHILAGLEPVEFVNIFPYWVKREDVANEQAKEGHTANITVIDK